ncbi:uncharacterized protein TRUGW13939_00924 [Talaromyces rugulosus]|uniref:FAD/NAD(P)-binding domain-containing protein n=1 Tax=Talaromyces rugulosus TaxID=121627 RepID=A0A7H8QIQ5_TALRU|nr:uncharacterized protein TRUGW13939_00924 [Talaromyces rugulosus]QKX53844.1 hypothetical protein TRUGW13939_00924 [Talaromyces rugulosus]
MQQPKNFDALIIGGGPAGLAAAMSMGRACRKVALFDSQEYRNERAPMMHNVLCHDGEKADLYRARALEELMDKYDCITLCDQEIASARHFGEGSQQFFQLTDAKGHVWTGLKLILATGTKDNLPSIKGYKALWGNGIVHCLFCDGFERRGGHIGVLGLQSLKDLGPLLMAFRLSGGRITVFTNGEAPNGGDAQRAHDLAAARGAQFDHRVLESVSENPAVVGVEMHFLEGPMTHVRMLLHSPPSTNRASKLIKSLGIETHSGPDGHIVTKTSFYETSLRGCFAAGDTASGAKVISVATATAAADADCPGTLAGIGAAKQLAFDEAIKAFDELFAGQVKGVL